MVYIGRYLNRPLHLFGGIGIGFTAIGLVICAYLTVLKISGEAIRGRPLLILGVLLLVVGVQLLTLGLMAQMMVLSRREGRRGELAAEVIERTVGFRPAGLSAAAGSGRSTMGASGPG